MAEAAAPDGAFAAAPRVEALQALDAWCALGARDATLDGSLPLRVVQGCEPMLDGTAMGVQVTLLAPLRLSRRWGRWRVEALPFSQRVERWGIEGDGPAGASSLARFERQRTASLAALVARGTLSPDDARGAPLAAVIQRGTQTALRLWTGFLVRVDPSARLLLLRASPRRSLGTDLTPAVLAAHLRWTPLVLDLSLDAVEGEVIVEGEVAALAVVPEPSAVECVPIGQAPELARATVDFYDPEYFAAKRRGEVTRKYRRLPRLEARSSAAWVRVASVTDDELVAGALRGAEGSLACVEMRCAAELSVRFDGQRVRLTADAGGLRARREAIEAAWARWATPDDPAGRGVLLYLTRYMTPHPFGEPHFFVKPCALVQTPPGWCTLIEGVSVEGVGDVLRGAVRTDVFHATPAVFALPPRAAPGTVPRGVLLARLFALPRAWLTPVVEARALSLEGPLRSGRGS